jgi:soluble lytic murein transglycosylase-like protein
MAKAHIKNQPSDGANVAAQRRLFLRAAGFLPTAAALGFAALPSMASAGGQVEEPLSDSVRTALSLAVQASSIPPVPVFPDEKSQQYYQGWLAEMSARLGKRRSFLGQQEREELLQTVWYEAKRAGLEVSLVLGLITVESNFRKYAISRVGARGFMQIMPFWSRVIGDGESSHLFHMQTNLRFGCVILRHYLDREKGDEYMALGRYNGSRGQPQYPNAVFGAQRQWLYI